MKQRIVSWHRVAAVMAAVTAGLAGGSSAVGQKSLMIGIDGLGSMGIHGANTPNLDRLIEGTFGGGAYRGTFSPHAFVGGVLGTPSQQITVSGPGWSSMLTGVWRDKHLVNGNSFSPQDFTNNPPYLEVLEENVPDVYSVSVINWSPIDTYVISRVDDADSRMDVRSTPGGDANVATVAEAQLAALDPNLPAAVFVSFDDVDGAGHGGGSYSQRYLDEVTDTDGLVGRLLDAVESRPFFATEDWQIVIAADHGHKPNGGHGGQSALERTISLIVTSRSAEQGLIPTSSGRPAVVDVAPTVLAHFGVAIPGQIVGFPRGDIVLPPSQPGLIDGLVAHLPFDGDTATGLAGAGGTENGTVQYGPGRFGQAVGVAAYGDGFVALNDDLGAMFGTQADFTLSLWVRYDAFSGDPPFFSNKDWASGTNTGINLALLGTHTPAFNTKGSSGSRQDLQPYRQFAPGSWQNVLIAVDRNGPTTLYIDGIMVGEIPNTSAGSFDGVFPFTFLNDGTGNYGFGSTISGLEIDEFAAWNRRLNLDEISTVARAAVPEAIGGSGTQRILLLEGFDGVPLGPSVDEDPWPSVPTPDGVWTKTPPAGWTIDDSGVPSIGDPNRGVTEWEGWSFTDRLWWTSIAQDQQRSQFTKGTGTVAVADPDEWDDKGSPSGLGPYGTFFSTPPIDLTGVTAGTTQFTFDSSWRPDAPQKVTLTLSYDGGDTIEVLRWESSGPLFKPDATNETVTVPLNNPAGASNVVITFGLFDAGNDWWWAIDNLELVGRVGRTNQTVFSEDFDDLDLGPPVDEDDGGTTPPPPPIDVWTAVPPTGWSVDAAGVPGAGTPDDGVTEWAGWGFPETRWWSWVAQDEDRSRFTRGRGVVAVADADEWADLPHPLGTYNTFLETPVIPLVGIRSGSVSLTFDSSWRSGGGQKANLTVAYDGGVPVELFRWDAASGDAVNERYEVPLENPSGARTMMVTFGLFDAADDGWWAIDNVMIVGNFCGDTCEGPRLISAVSRKTHGDAGAFDLALPLAAEDAAIEGRVDGPTTVILRFDKPVTALDGVLDETEVTLSAGTLGTVSLSDRELTILLSGVPEASCLAITLAGVADLDGQPLEGDHDVHVRVLPGSVDEDDVVDVVDMSRVKGRLFEPVDTDNFRADVSADGTIDVTDMASVKGHLFQTAVCP